jgi:hypothetical protein
MERESGLNEVPACFSVERDADGVVKIRYQRPGPKRWPLITKLFLGIHGLFACYLLVEFFLLYLGSPYYSSPNLPTMILFPLQIGVMIGAIRTMHSNKTFLLQRAHVEIINHHMPIGDRFSIPKEEILLLVQSRTMLVIRERFDLRMMGSENCLLLIGESAKATRWLGETLVQWAGAEAKLVAEDGGRMSNPAKTAEG